LSFVPLEAASYDVKFDLNDFALRVLSVDYQRKTSDAHGTMADTQVVMREKTTGVYSYVHHFTLRDLQARGLVRPMCFCYISADHHKIMSQFIALRKAFNMVCARVV
jgi:hypothetical protein